MPESSPDPRSRAATALAARRGQIHALRLRVVTLAVSVFIAAWAVVFVQLVKGHDPALASTGGTVVTQSADPATTDDEDASSSTSTSTDTSSSDSSASGSDATAASPTAVTTRQS
jgi:cytoskeletal protein RodZ